MSNLISRRAAAGLATAGALLLGALAAVPQAGAQPVYVCQKVGGTFHVVASKQKCKKGESKLGLGVTQVGAMGMVGATGPAGVTGSVGAAGPAGPIGPEGPAGKSGSAAAQGEAGPKGVTGAIGPTGPAGPTGPTGTAGATGAAGGLSAVTVVEATGKLGKDVPEENANPKVTIVATCKSGEVAISGGFFPPLTGTVLFMSRRTAAGTGWEVEVENTTENAESTVPAYAYCVKGS